MENKQINADLYKKIICDAVQDIEDGRFLRQLYAFICGGHYKQPASTFFDKQRQNN